MEAGSIKAIDKGSVHRICSGQVVLTLATAVKELVENSIDAGATIVDIKLKEYGSEVVEVSDNGSGVEEKNFEGLTLKHHTSKLEEFSDLINVETFGFRGEALSSLCALSDLCIVTRHKDVEVASKLEYDHHGKMTNRTAVARQVGTTTMLQNLFYTLPVRHKEFHRNLKKEFVKMVQVLNAYCLINTGVRITCTNQAGKGNKTTVVSSKGNPTIKENISNIFGPKQQQNLMEFHQCNPSEDISSEYGLKSSDTNTQLFRIEGYISKCEHGQGRSSADRQFYFINKRPCDHSKLSKLVNEVYHQYNRHQYPFVVLSISMCRESVDVNVTPDKRQLFIENEKILLAVVKTSLVQMFEPTVNLYNVNAVPLTNHNNDYRISPQKQSEVNCINEGLPVSAKPSITSTLGRLKRSFSSTFASKEDTASPQQPNKQRKLDTFVVKSYMKSEDVKSHYDDDIEIVHHDKEIESISNTQVVFESVDSLDIKSNVLCDSNDLLMFGKERREVISVDSESGISSSQELTDSQSLSCITISSSSGSQSQELDREDHLHKEIEKDTTLIPVIGQNKTNIDCIEMGSVTQNSGLCKDHPGKKLEMKEEKLNLVISHNQSDFDCNQNGSNTHSNEDILLSTSDCVEIDVEETFDKMKSTSCVQLRTDGDRDVLGNKVQSNDPVTSAMQVTCYDVKHDQKRPEKIVKFDFQSFRNKVRRRSSKNKTGGSFCRTFRAKISPTDNRAAEEELQKEIKKDMFCQMDILGQFNLGFIITKFRDDVFIVDQHATDEKYNFEMLQRHTVIQSQKLIHPQNLELTSSNEIILMENLDVFRKNGFDFIIDEQGDPTQRVRLISTPVSKNWTFGKDDIEELIFMLTDSTGVMCRPSRVRQMFASRSCRKSVMIGTALNKSEMKKLVDHMGQIDQPWNCPHGRPTMRHLINLNMVPR